MHTRILFRLFLLLALACNGVVAAHAAAVMAVASVPATAAEDAPCHGHAAQPEAPAPQAGDPGPACCKLPCQCACSVQASIAPGPAPGVPVASLRGMALPPHYRSLAPGVLLRPPIA